MNLVEIKEETLRALRLSTKVDISKEMLTVAKNPSIKIGGLIAYNITLTLLGVEEKAIITHYEPKSAIDRVKRYLGFHYNKKAVNRNATVRILKIDNDYLWSLDVDGCNVTKI